MASKYKDIRFKWLEDKGFNVLADNLQYEYVQSLLKPYDELQGVFCESPAGTGKTVLAALIGAYGIERGDYDRIIYIRNTDVVGQGVGFLPGELDNKIAPHMVPFIEALDHVKPGLFEVWYEEGKVQATTATYLRGVTFHRAFVIIDEAQNMSIEELQTIYTRAKNSCKIVTTGSLRQIDNGKLKRIAGFTPFEVFMIHFESMSSEYHELRTNYRGEWSKWADNVQKTIKDLTGVDYDPSEYELEDAVGVY